jgi:hypothetical protein
MRILIISENIVHDQRYGETPYCPPNDIILAVDDLNDKQFISSVFDYDVSIIHIEKPRYHTSGYYDNLPKLQKDTLKALQHGRTVICLPQSQDFISEKSGKRGMTAYKWLEPLGVELNDNKGQNITPSGAGKAAAIEAYLKYAPTYYQIINKPQPSGINRLAVVGETEIMVGMEQQVEMGTLVILPPPIWEPDYYQLAMQQLIGVALHYYYRNQRKIPLGDTPKWLESFIVPHAESLISQINKLTEEKERYDRLAYILYGTGEELESSVVSLLEDINLSVERQGISANIDLKAKHTELGSGFAIEITGTKDIIRKDSSKIGQAFKYLTDRAGTKEEKDRLIIVANTQFHLDPKQRNTEGYTPEVVELLHKNGVLMITTVQLYQLWRMVHEGEKTANDLIKELYKTSGLYKEITP